MRTVAGDAAVRAGSLPVVLVTLYAPGFVARAASEPISLATATPDGPYNYDARLLSRIDFSPEADLFGAEFNTSLTTARVSMVLDERSLPASLELRGAALAFSRCEVAMAWPGQSWVQRRVLIAGGIVSGLRLGLAGQPVEFVVDGSTSRTSAQVTDPERSMGDYYPIDIVGSSYSSLAGKAWPVVIGQCFKIPAYKLGKAVAGAGNYFKLGLAGHHFYSTTLPTIYEDGAVYVPSGVLTVVNTTDTAGAEVCWISSDNIFDFEDVDGGFTVSTGSGGIAAAWGQGAALDAAGCVAKLLQMTGLPVDWTATRAALEQLGAAWRVGIYIDRGGDALGILRDRVLPFLPLIEEQGDAGGYALRYADPFAQSPVVDLVLGGNLVGRVGDLEQVSDPDDIINQVTVRYSYDSFLGDYTDSVTIGRDENALARVSVGLLQRADPTDLGIRSTEVEVNICWSDAAAAQIAHWMVNRQALPRFALSYYHDPSLYWLKEGTVARLYDETLGISARKVVVRRTSPMLSPPLVILELVPDATEIG